jgi:hypothetical protein
VFIVTLPPNHGTAAPVAPFKRATTGGAIAVPATAFAGGVWKVIAHAPVTAVPRLEEPAKRVNAPLEDVAVEPQFPDDATHAVSTAMVKTIEPPAGMLVLETLTDPAEEDAVVPDGGVTLVIVRPVAAVSVADVIAGLPAALSFFNVAVNVVDVPAETDAGVILRL